MVESLEEADREGSLRMIDSYRAQEAVCEKIPVTKQESITETVTRTREELDFIYKLVVRMANHINGIPLDRNVNEGAVTCMRDEIALNREKAVQIKLEIIDICASLGIEV